MEEKKAERFSGRLGLILAALGMAIGTGNIWRFPRVVAENGGGTFLIPWIIFLFTWSIPILIAEFTLGKASRRGPVGAFAKLLGNRSAWMGAFMALVTLAIATYYSVVTGWTLKYLVATVSEIINQGGHAVSEAALDAQQVASQHEAARKTFEDFTSDPWQPVAYHFGCVLLVSLIIWSGVKWGVELACKLLIPLLFVLLATGAFWAITRLEGSGRGLHWFFTPDWSALGHPKVWIAGLSQSAWSTGAGWGLILAYGAYSRWDEDAVGTNATAGLGNNGASLLAGLFIFPAVFAIFGQAGLPDDQIVAALRDSGEASTGLSFTYAPFIFKSLGQAGLYCTAGFFLALFFAALSSLIALYEMGARVLGDFGLSRGKSVIVLFVLCGGVGVLSARDMSFFNTIDWIASLGLIVGGLLVVWAVQIFGANPFRIDLINNTGASVRLGTFFNWLFLYIIPIQGLGLLTWYLYHAVTNAPAGTDPWDPFATGGAGAGPFLFWALWVIVPLFLFSPWIGQQSLKGSDRPGPEEKPANLWIRLLVLPIPYLLTVPALKTRVLPWLQEQGNQYGEQLNRWEIVAAFVCGVLGLGFVIMLFKTTNADAQQRKADRKAEARARRKEASRLKRRARKTRGATEEQPPE